MPKGPRVQPYVPGNSGPALRAHGVDQLSRDTRAWGRGPAVSTCSPRQIGPGPEVPLGRHPLPGNLRSCPRTRIFNQLSQATRAHVREPAGSTSCPVRLGPGSEGPRCRPAVPYHSRLRPMSRRSTSCPRRLWPTTEGAQMLTSYPRRPGPGPGPMRSKGCPRGIRPVPAGQQVLPVDPGDSVPCLRAQDVDQIFRALGPGCEVRRGRPTVPHDSGTGQKARMFKQLSRTTRAWVRWPAWSTSFLG